MLSYSTYLTNSDHTCHFSASLLLITVTITVQGRRVSQGNGPHVSPRIYLTAFLTAPHVSSLSFNCPSLPSLHPSLPPTAGHSTFLLHHRWHGADAQLQHGQLQLPSLFMSSPHLQCSPDPQTYDRVVRVLLGRLYLGLSLSGHLVGPRICAGHKIRQGLVPKQPSVVREMYNTRQVHSRTYGDLTFLFISC